MKSMSRGFWLPLAATSTMLSPQRMTTDPPACLAHLPVSTMISLPPTMAVSRTKGIRDLLVTSPAASPRGLVPLSKLPIWEARRNDQTSAISISSANVSLGFLLLAGALLHSREQKPTPYRLCWVWARLRSSSARSAGVMCPQSRSSRPTRCPALPVQSKSSIPRQYELPSVRLPPPQLRSSLAQASGSPDHESC